VSVQSRQCSYKTGSYKKVGHTTLICTGSYNPGGSYPGGGLISQLIRYTFLIRMGHVFCICGVVLALLSRRLRAPFQAVIDSCSSPID